MTTWTRRLKHDPLPWLLEEDTPAIRHLALRQLLDQPENTPDVRHARAAAMQADPIAAILAAQHPDGFWVKPGPGYAPKYRGTVWQVIFLDQLVDIDQQGQLSKWVTLRACAVLKAVDG